MSPAIHGDRALKGVLEGARELSGCSGVRRVLVVEDIFGGITVVAWVDGGFTERTEVNERIARAAGPYLEGIELVRAGDILSGVYEAAWREGLAVDKAFPSLRFNPRNRTHGGWLSPPADPPWPKDGADKGPPVVVFYSFKGGVGRTTALTAFAIRRAQEGDRVVVLDLDLDAPGIGTFLAPPESGATASYGVLDFLLDREHEEPDVREHAHIVRVPGSSESEDIVVLPAGRVNSRYVQKLARVDLEPPDYREEQEERGDSTTATEENPLRALLHSVRREFKPKWILLDARAGLADPAGSLLSGLAHLHVLFGTSSEQTWDGLRVILGKTGAARVRDAKSQVECVLVHTMIPTKDKLAGEIHKAFVERARDLFEGQVPEDAEPRYLFEEAWYYAEEDRDDLWSLRDAEIGTAPHRAVAIHYNELVPSVRTIEQFAREIATDADYGELEKRILERVGSPARGDDIG